MRTAQEAREYIATLKAEGMPLKDITKMMMLEAKASNGSSVATKEKSGKKEQKEELLEAVDMNAGVANLDKIFGGMDAKFIDWNGKLCLSKTGIGGKNNSWCGLFIPLSQHENKVIPELVRAKAEEYIKLMEEHIVALQSVADWSDTLSPIQPVKMPPSKHKIGDVEQAK